MFGVKSLSILLFSSVCLNLAGLGVGREICCAYVGCFTNNYPFDNMPMPLCPEDVQPSMRVYTRINIDSGQVITPTTVPPHFNENLRKTVFIIHGYINEKDTGWLHNIKNSMLDRYDYNIIIVSWEGGSWNPWYPASASNTRTVGAHVARVAKNLVDHTGISPGSLWCVGHSLGSHVCGHAGRRFKIGRITGLDPAGPWFEDKDWSVGLSPSCADFVDCWHTHGKANVVMNLGTLKPLGHVDFYPNGGGEQPGCVIDSMKDKQGTRTLTKQPYVDPTPACSHMRVIDLFREAITSECEFRVKERCEDAFNIPYSCYVCNTAICNQTMGMEADLLPGRGSFWFETNRQSPFCQG